jgi:hypothetical protein
MTETGPKCSAGFYCTGKATSATPTDAVTGNVCPSGSFCEEGSASPTPCDVGTYLAYTGAVSRSECVLCTPGKYCATAGLSQPTGNCDAGFYCPAGSTSSSPFNTPCPIGMKCPSSAVTGSATAQPCPPGEYTIQSQ